VIECDRKGASDVVHIVKEDTHLCDSNFIHADLLQKYGCTMVKGGKTDVVELKMRGLNIPVCNVSCGYYDAHKNSEYTRFSELERCLAFVKEILMTK
jgi:di/tripeptidase